jgi:hypothetical protein
MRRLIVLAALFACSPAQADCDGRFRRDSFGTLPSEGGPEPNGARRKAGDMARFVRHDAYAGERFVTEAGGTYYNAADVDLKACRLRRLSPPGS